MNKVKLTIPIQTPDQIVVRDHLAKILSKDYNAVVIEFSETTKIVDGEILKFPLSTLIIYVNKISDNLLAYFKDFSVLISELIDDSVLLEITSESVYVGTAQPKED